MRSRWADCIECKTHLPCKFMHSVRVRKYPKGYKTIYICKSCYGQMVPSTKSKKL